MKTGDFERAKEDILFETFSVLFAKKNSRWTKRSEARRFARWKTEHAETIGAFPWEAIVRIYTNPPGIALLADRKRQDIVFGIVKAIRELEEHH